MKPKYAAVLIGLVLFGIFTPRIRASPWQLTPQDKARARGGVPACPIPVEQACPWPAGKSCSESYCIGMSCPYTERTSLVNPSYTAIALSYGGFNTVLSTIVICSRVESCAAGCIEFAGAYYCYRVGHYDTNEVISHEFADPYCIWVGP